MASPLPARVLQRPADVARLACLFHALSDDTRLRIVGMLLGGEKCVCDLTDALDTGQSRLSFHLKVLKEAGLVNDRRDGRWIHYSLNPEILAELQEFVGTVQGDAARLEVTRCCEEKKTSLGQLYGISLF